MKILVITNLYPPHEIGGYEIRCRDVCQRLESYGHEIHVLTSAHQIAGRAETPETAVYRQLLLVGMYGYPWPPIRQLYPLEKHNHATLRRTIEAVRPDLIHVWNMGGLSKSLLLRLEQSGVPVVYDVSDHWIANSLRNDAWLSWWNKPGSLARAVTRRMLGILGIRRVLERATPTASWESLEFQHIYFCSAFMRDLSATNHPCVAHGSVIHCGIDTAAFTVKQDYSGFAKLLWVGRLAADKDPLTAIRALAAAHRAGLTNLTLDLYGHGAPAFVTLVKAEIAAHGLTAHAHLQLATAAAMRGLYAEYDALLFTSNWGEPFALTPLEAMAAGLPVITSLDGGQAELARHGRNCLVAAVANPDLYAARLTELAATPQLRASLAATALAEVRQRFDIEPISRQIEAFLLTAMTP